jgi:hypothetical protein
MPSRRTPRTHTMVITSGGWTIKVLMRKAAPSPYTVNGKVTGGFVDIAHPAKYGDTGIKRFIINQDQVVSSRKILEKKPPPWQEKGRQSRTRRSRGITANLRVSENKSEALVTGCEKKNANGVAAQGIEETNAIAEEGFIYGLPIVINYAVLYEYALDCNSGQFKAPFNKINVVASECQWALTFSTCYEGLSQDIRGTADC